MTELNLREKILLKLFCYPPPGRSYDPAKDDPTFSRMTELTATQLLAGELGDTLAQNVQDMETLDFGCGTGELVAAIAGSGAKRSVGVDIRPLFERGRALARQLEVEEKVEFTTDPTSAMLDESFDIIISRDCFEHFADPPGILVEMKRLLKPDGRILISFGPPWYHPRGAHMFFMFRLPWAQLFFSERTIMRVRSLYRDDGAKAFHEAPGGLNQMTVRRFLRIVRNSGLKVEKLDLVPIRNLKPLVMAPGIREFFTSLVKVSLIKDASSIRHPT